AARARSAAAPPLGTEGPGGGSCAVSATNSNNNNKNNNNSNKNNNNDNNNNNNNNKKNNNMNNNNNNQLNLGRTLRYAAFGSYDGFAGHHWFEFLDSTLPKTGSGILDTALKVLSDS
ncbi:unnamed protein product, partial [Polarella glacialis]